MSELERALEQLAWFIDEGDEAVLAEAIAGIAGSGASPARVLAEVGALRGDPAMKARALTAVRRALGLALVPGAVCQR